MAATNAIKCSIEGPVLKQNQVCGFSLVETITR